MRVSNGGYLAQPFARGYPRKLQHTPISHTLCKPNYERNAWIYSLWAKVEVLGLCSSSVCWNSQPQRTSGFLNAPIQRGPGNGCVCSELWQVRGPKKTSETAVWLWENLVCSLVTLPETNIVLVAPENGWLADFPFGLWGWLFFGG